MRPHPWSLSELLLCPGKGFLGEHRMGCVCPKPLKPSLHNSAGGCMQVSWTFLSRSNEREQSSFLAFWVMLSEALKSTKANFVIHRLSWDMLGLSIFYTFVPRGFNQKQETSSYNVIYEQMTALWFVLHAVMLNSFLSLARMQNHLVLWGSGATVCA